MCHMCGTTIGMIALMMMTMMINTTVATPRAYECIEDKLRGWDGGGGCFSFKFHSVLSLLHFLYRLIHDP